jgi:predicted transglutaminase-like protease
MRYYHIYMKNELVKEINKLEPQFIIESEGWEKSNWYVTLHKC